MCVYEYTHTHTHITKVVAALLAENSEAALRRKDPTKAFAKTFKNPATAFSTTSAALTSALCGGTRTRARCWRTRTHTCVCVCTGRGEWGGDKDLHMDIYDIYIYIYI